MLHLHTLPKVTKKKRKTNWLMDRAWRVNCKQQILSRCCCRDTSVAEEEAEGVLEGEALEVEEACRPILQWPLKAE
jgi:hypothetical protein